MRRHASPGLILAQAARRSGDGGRGVPQAVQLLLRRARLPQTADASLAALPRPQSVSGGSGDLVCHSGDRRRGATFGSSRPADAGTLAGMVALDLHRDPVLAGGQGSFHAAGGRGQPRRDAGRHSAALRGRAHPRLQSCSGQERPNRPADAFSADRILSRRRPRSFLRPASVCSGSKAAIGRIATPIQRWRRAHPLAQPGTLLSSITSTVVMGRRERCRPRGGAPGDD